MSNIKNFGDQPCPNCKRSKKSEKIGNDIRKVIREMYCGDPYVERLTIDIEMRKVYDTPQNYAHYTYNLNM